VKQEETSTRVPQMKTHLEWLRQEVLCLTRPRDSELVILGKLVHTQNGNDVLERLVVLEKLLDVTGGVVVLSTDNVRVENPRG
jgi:hypothetical protein